jgi:low affinity Fe/Cu permease
MFGLAQLSQCAARCANMRNGNEHSKLYELGGKLSSWASDFSAHPYVQFAFVILCVVWFASGMPVDILTAALSILAISLTQMVLNRQNEREAEAHRRDVAMHAKLDELVIASRRARDEMAGIEELEEEDIVQLKEHAAEARDAAEEAEKAVKKTASKL